MSNSYTITVINNTLALSMKARIFDASFRAVALICHYLNIIVALNEEIKFDMMSRGLITR